MTDAKQPDVNPPEPKKNKKTRQANLKDLNFLTEADQETLIQLQNALSSSGSRNLRGKQLKTFADMIKIIHKFCIRGDAYDWRRCYVCGICWLPNGIAINNRRFGCLLGKCKSSINGSFQQLGYTTAPSRSDSYDSIVEVIPILKNDMPSLREWTLRLNSAQPQDPSLLQPDENGQLVNAQITDQQAAMPLLDDNQDPTMVVDHQILSAPQPFSVQSMPPSTNTQAELQAAAASFGANIPSQQQPSPFSQVVPIAPTIQPDPEDQPAGNDQEVPTPNESQ